MQKRGKAFSEFKQVVGKLPAGIALEPRYRDQDLSGQYKGTRECHIEPDWLLIYELTKDDIILIRTGTHSDLFD
jgi:mRNA interferase YafQ